MWLLMLLPFADTHKVLNVVTVRQVYCAVVCLWTAVLLSYTTHG